MIPKRNRLKKKKDFEETFKKGKRLKSEFLEIRIRKVNKKDKKIAFVAPVKAFKKATERNKMKRKMREAFKGLMKNLDEGVRIIIIAGSGAEKKSIEELEKAIKKQLVQFKFLKE